MKMATMALLLLLLISSALWAWSYLNVLSANDDLAREAALCRETQEVLARLVLEAPRSGEAPQVAVELARRFHEQVVKAGESGQVEVGGLSLTYRNGVLADVDVW